MRDACRQARVVQSVRTLPLMYRVRYSRFCAAGITVTSLTAGVDGSSPSPGIFYIQKYFHRRPGNFAGGVFYAIRQGIAELGDVQNWLHEQSIRKYRVPQSLQLFNYERNQPMSRMSDAVKEIRSAIKTKAERNFMGGISYGLNAIDTMKMVMASSIFGEPQYYRFGEFAEGFRHADEAYRVHPLFKEYTVLGTRFDGMKTSQIMETVIDEALEEDFEQTIRWALTLRTDFLMRLNPQVIMVRAAVCKKRAAFNQSHPGLFSQINLAVMSRADEPAVQLTYYLYKNKGKNRIPAILKRNWAQKLSSLNPYQIAKYKDNAIGMINTVRICHANSEPIDELMHTGTVKVPDVDKTWESLRSVDMSWKEILETIELGHMASLRNLRGIFTEIDDIQTCREFMNHLKAGVPGGKQFPFRYWSAYRAVKDAKESVHHYRYILDALEECVDIACDNMPYLPGRTMCLSDNSGSAWGAFTSEYGRVTVAEIGNLSSIITARNSDEGYVGKFGDELKVFLVSKSGGVLERLENITKNQCQDVGGATENGIWIFFEKAIRKREHWDNIFIYSDMQAGHGGLYGTAAGKAAYTIAGYASSEHYVDVAKLIDAYRRKVNPKVNVFSVQTAGYTNICVPEYGYRTNFLYGWTGKELIFADEMRRFWDRKDEERGSEI